MRPYLNGALFGVAVASAIVGQVTAFLVTASIALAATYLAQVIDSKCPR
jgi:hypothetical protein